ncbi:ATP-dependent RecD-like DNA helicase [Candidatus Parcubacteria bacterium]|nr:ATP-dependent RecD-like DNA helicase [Candidatus Parcubacteria bacterium]
MSYTLSADQAEALKVISHWYKNQTAPYLTLGGYAGTGKTTLIAYLRQALRQRDEDSRVAFCAFTGKAARVLTDKLREQKVPRRGDSVSTIHSLIYTAESDARGQVINWQRKDELDYDLVIVDEASMVDQAIWDDLLSFNLPVLAVGDHGQLPPVGSSFNLMAAPAVRLEHIFRQAETSPIIEVATMARTSGQVPVGEYGPGVRKLSRRDSDTGQTVQDLLEGAGADQLVLCGYNHTRTKLNQAIRGYRDYDSPLPQSGDRVVCLRNNRKAKIYNGMTGHISYLTGAENDPDKLWYYASIRLDNEDYDYEGYVLRGQFGAGETLKSLPKNPDGAPGDLFDFGYALTVHKAQGSQARRVLVFEERFPRSSDEDWRRWLYTAVTRATDELVIVGE